MNTIPKLLRLSLSFAVALPCASTLFGQNIGQWDFNNSNLVQTAGANLGNLQYSDGAGTTSNRTAFGSTLAQKQTVQNWVADSVAEIQAARLLTLHAAQKIDSGEDPRVEISVIKFFGAKILHDVIDRAIQVHGALGVSGDTPLEFMYRQARAARIYDGPDEVHRMVVARRVLESFSQGPGWDFE